MDALIEMSGLSKHYRMGAVQVTALHDVELQVQRGGFVALCGPSGSGKSTLLNVCGLIDAHDRGRFLFEGREVKGQTPAQLTRWRRDAIGFVFQGFNLIPVMTAFENVEYPLLLNDTPAAQRRARVREMLERVGLAGQAGHRPDELSGGQRQRVAIARALIKAPLLVVADEPTANLDSATAAQVIDLMHALAQESGTTFLIATHDERMTRRCERVVHLVDGMLQPQAAQPPALSGVRAGGGR